MDLKHIKRAIAAILLPPIGYMLFRFFWYTSTKRFHFSDKMPSSQCIFASWHEMLLFTPQVYRHFYPKRKASAIVSRHFDGEIIARIIGFFRLRPLRGSSSKGAARVLLEAVRALKAGEDVLLTPDGPRGPRHHLGDGIVALYEKRGVPVVTMSYVPKRYWRLKSWDRFLIPKPFTAIDIYLDIHTDLPKRREEAKGVLTKAMLEHLPQEGLSDA